MYITSEELPLASTREIHPIASHSTSSLVLQDLEFEDIIDSAEAEELEGQGLFGAAFGAGVGFVSGAVGGFASYGAGYAYDRFSGRPSSWSWRDAGRNTAVGAVGGAAAGAVAGAFAPTP